MRRPLIGGSSMSPLYWIRWMFLAAAFHQAFARRSGAIVQQPDYSEGIYHLYTVSMTWDEAVSENGCHSLISFSQLAFFTTTGRYDKAETIVVNNALTDSIWIGLNDKRLEGIYRWNSGATLAYQDKWATGHPEPTTSKNCVAWVRQGPAGYRFEMRDCSEQHWVMCFMTANLQNAVVQHSSLKNALRFSENIPRWTYYHDKSNCLIEPKRTLWYTNVLKKCATACAAELDFETKSAMFIKDDECYCSQHDTLQACPDGVVPDTFLRVSNQPEMCHLTTVKTLQDHAAHLANCASTSSITPTILPWVREERNVADIKAFLDADPAGATDTFWTDGTHTDTGWMSHTVSPYGVIFTAGQPEQLAGGARYPTDGTWGLVYDMAIPGLRPALKTESHFGICMESLEARCRATVENSPNPEFIYSYAMIEGVGWAEIYECPGLKSDPTTSKFYDYNPCGCDDVVGSRLSPTDFTCQDRPCIAPPVEAYAAANRDWVNENPATPVTPYRQVNSGTNRIFTSCLTNYVPDDPGDVFLIKKCYVNEHAHNKTRTYFFNMTLPYCKADCGVPTLLAGFENVTYNSTFEYGVATYKCLPGTTISVGVQEIDVTCPLTPTWETPASSCVAIVACPEISEDPHIVAASGPGPGPRAPDYAVGAPDSFSCAAGYGFRSGATSIAVTCDGLTGVMIPTTAGPMEICELQCASTPPTLAGAGAPVIPSSFPGDNATYTCDTNYFTDELGGTTSTSTCLDGGLWSDPTHTCLVKCTEPPAMTESTVAGTDRLEGANVNYTCNSGHAFLDGSSTKTSICNSGGEWSLAVENCLVLCSNPAPDVMGTDSPAVVNGRYPGDTATYTCAAGYFTDEALSTNSTATCQNTGVWSAPTPTCLIQCPDPPTKADNTNVATGRLEGTTATYTCSAGYLFFTTGTNSKVSTCDSAGNWTPEPENCLIECPVPLDITDGTKVEDGRLEGATVNYTCISGHAFADNSSAMTSTCDSTGAWTPQAENCTIQCPVPPTMAYNTYVPTGQLAGATVNYTCDEGHLFADGSSSKVSTCDSGGAWIPTPEDCLVQCSNPAPVVTGTASSVVIGQFPGDTATYTCASGYFTDASSGTTSTATCGASGLWSAPTPTCLIQCTVPPNMANNNYVETGRLQGDTVTYTCTAGKDFNDLSTTKTSTCDSGGKWTPTPEDCLDVYAECAAGLVYPNMVATVGSPPYNVNDKEVYECTFGFVFRAPFDRLEVTCNRRTGTLTADPGYAIIPCSKGIFTALSVLPSSTPDRYDKTSVMSCASECAVRCHENSLCDSFNWNQQTLECQLLGHPEGAGLAGTSKNWFIIHP